MYQKFICIGNLTNDAEVKNFNGREVSQFGIAINKKYKTQSGEIKENTTYLQVAAWNKGGLYQYLKKGTQVFIEGEINIQENNGKYYTKIIAERINLLGGARNDAPKNAPQPQYGTGNTNAPRGYSTRQKVRTSNPASAPQQTDIGAEIYEEYPQPDDLPF